MMKGARSGRDGSGSASQSAPALQIVRIELENIRCFEQAARDPRGEGLVVTLISSDDPAEKQRASEELRQIAAGERSYTLAARTSIAARLDSFRNLLDAPAPGP